MIWGSAGFLIGIILGSLAKALADRSLDNKSFWGRSYCPRCQHKLAWYDLFPIISYIFLRGKCRYCRREIKIDYLLVELLMGLLIGFLFWQTFSNFRLPASGFQAPSSLFTLAIFLSDLILKTFFIVVLIILFLTDFKKMFIPDRIILPSIVAGIVLSLIVAILKIGYFYYLLSENALSRFLLPPHSEYFQRHALTIAQPFFLSLLMGLLIGGFFFSLIVVTKGKGMGGGDVKLGAFMGIMLGFPSALFALVGAFLTGAILSVALIVMGKKHFGQTIPFGPFLSLGSLIMLFWGNQIIDLYLHFGK